MSAPRVGLKFRLSVVIALVVGMLASNLELPTASAITGLGLAVDYTPDSSTVATSTTRGSVIGFF